MEEKPLDRPGPSERLQQAAVYYKLGKYAEAQALLDELAREKPDSRHVLYSRGMCLAATGHLEEAWKVCEALEQIKGHTAASFAFKLKARLEERENKSGRPPRRTVAVMAKGLLLIAWQQPKFLLLGAIVFTGGILLLVALASQSGGSVEPNERKPAYRVTGQSVAMAAAQGGYLEVPAFYLAGRDEPVKYAVVFYPRGELDSSAQALDDAIGAQVAQDWPALREQVEEALTMAAQQDDPIEGVPRNELARTAVIPREGLSLAGGLRGKTVDRFAPGPAQTLRALSIAAGAPDSMVLWPQGIALAGIEGDVCWWGRIGVATDDKGVITHLLVRSVPERAAAPAAVPESDPPEDAAQ